MNVEVFENEVNSVLSRYIDSVKALRYCILIPSFRRSTTSLGNERKYSIVCDIKVV